MLELQHNYTVLLQQKEETIKLLQVRISKAQSHNEYLEQLLSNYQQALAKIKSTPVGNRERKRKLAHIETLAAGGGARKQRIRAARLTVHYCTKI